MVLSLKGNQAKNRQAQTDRQVLDSLLPNHPALSLLTACSIFDVPYHHKPGTVHKVSYAITVLS